MPGLLCVRGSLPDGRASVWGRKPSLTVGFPAREREIPRAGALMTIRRRVRPHAKRQLFWLFEELEEDAAAVLRVQEGVLLPIAIDDAAEGFDAVRAEGFRGFLD